MTVSSEFPLGLQQQPARGAPTPAGNDRIRPRARMNRLLGRRPVAIGAGIGGCRRLELWPNTLSKLKSSSGTACQCAPDRVRARRRIDTHMVCSPAAFARSTRFSPASRAISLQPALSRSRLHETSNSSTRRSASCPSGISGSQCSARRGRDRAGIAAPGRGGREHHAAAGKPGDRDRASRRRRRRARRPVCQRLGAF